MQQERWEKIETGFNQASVLAPEQQEQFLFRFCGEDLELRREVTSLLEEESKSEDFLSKPAFETGLKLLSENEYGQLSLAPGTVINSYTILNLIGAGGSSEVYLARDDQLDRLVAIKLLRPKKAASRESLERFQREAQFASAVTHPNITHVYTLGIYGDKYFIVMEYVRGVTLRELIRSGINPLRAASIAAQIAAGLAAAHALGVLHRDIKPENIIIQNDDIVKILDFGLAKLVAEPISVASELSINKTKVSQEHLIGTAYYMSPEQIQNREVSFGTDIWSLGVVLYEMVTGNQPFEGLTIIDVLSSITHDDLPETELEEFSGPVLGEIIRHCLKKKNEKRFQSASDLAFALETFYKNYRPDTAAPRNRRKTDRGLIKSRHQSNRWDIFVISLILLIAVVAGGTYLYKNNFFRPTASDADLLNTQPVYRQTTFQRGTVWSARFSPDSSSIIYSATWNAEKIRIFTTQAESPDNKPLNLTGTNLLAVSSRGELALLKNEQYLYQFVSRGTLLQLPINGDTPKAVAENVQEADWSPDGENLAIVRWANGKNRLEYPIGHVLYETDGYLNNLRIAPQGNLIAFSEHPKQWDDRGHVSVIDLEGQKQTLTDEWSGLEGLAWNPVSGEIWFTASRIGENYAVYAVTTEKKIRVVERAPSHLLLYDIAKDGRALVSRAVQTLDIFGTSPESKSETVLSWLNQLSLSALSPDGKYILMSNVGMGSGINDTVYLKKNDQSQPIKLGEGRALALSPDAQFAVAKINHPKKHLVLLPVGAGEKRELPAGDFEYYDRAAFFPDGKRILFTGSKAGERKRSFAQNLETGAVTPLTPEGISGYQLAPDGEKLLVRDASGAESIFLLSEQRLIPIKNFGEDEGFAGWSADSNSIFVFRSLDIPIEVYRLQIETGRKELFKKIIPVNPAGTFGEPYVFVTPDAKNYVYGLRRYLFELYVVDNMTN